MPVGDWQFWVVTGLAVVALAWLVKSALPKKPGRRGTHASLTVSAEKGDAGER